MSAPTYTDAILEVDHVAVFKLALWWVYEPRAADDAPAWQGHVPWNKASPLYGKPAQAQEAARRRFPGRRVEVLNEEPLKAAARVVETAAEAIARSDAAAPRDWKAAADAVIRDLAARRPVLTADDVWAGLEAAGVEGPDERRALGGRLQAAAHRKLIESTGQTVKSTRDVAHGSFVTAWRSLIFTSDQGRADL